MKTSLSTLILILSLVFNSYAAPVDYNNDGLSDPVAVEESEGSLVWKSLVEGDENVLNPGLGELGNHLAPGDYSDTGVMSAVVTSAGVWNFADESSVEFGAEGASYLAGGDFNGDGLTDLVYSSNACLKKRSTFYVRTNPLDKSSTDYTLRAIRGYYYKFYMDVNADGKDDLCSLAPLRNSNGLSPKFKAVCRDATSGQKLKAFRVGRVVKQPVRIKLNGVDYLVVYSQSASRTNVRLVNTDGRRHDRFKIASAGDLLVGNYLDVAAESIAVVSDAAATIYNLITKETVVESFPDGIPFDQYNIEHFTDTEDCYCTTKRLRRNGDCKVVASDPDTGNNPIEGDPDVPNTPDAPKNSKYYIPDNCSNPPEHISPHDGFKCIASATRGGSVVCLLPYQFTWGPHKTVTDHHGYSFACNRNDVHFSKVQLFLNNGQVYDLVYAGCHNYVATPDGSVGRQHFRNEGVKWDSIKNKVVRMEMSRDGNKTCLSF